MTWILAIIGIAALIVIHEAGHAIVAKWCGMRVERFSLFFPPIIARKQIGETEFAIGSVPLGGYVRIAGQSPDDELPEGQEHRSYANRPVWQRMAVIAAGPAANIIAAVVLIAVILMVSGVSKVQPVVGAASIVAPAAGVLKSGDQIVSVDGVSGGVDALVTQTRSHRCSGAPVTGCVASAPAVVVYTRDGMTQTARISPQFDSKAGAMRLGFSFSIVHQPLGPLAAVGRSVKIAWNVSTGAIKGFVAIATPEGRRQVSGIVGVSVVTQQAFSQDVVYALELLAFISLLIAIVNLFPILPLDGGHLFWLLVEKLRGRPASQELLGRVTAVGLVLVLGLFLMGLTNDIGRLGGAGFSTLR